MLPTANIAAEPLPMPASRTADLLAAFFSGKSPYTLAAYRADLEDFRAFIGSETVEAAAATLLGGSNGHANGLALAWRSHLMALGRAPATINRRLSALRALADLGRMLGVITWGIEVRNLPAQSYRDTKGPQRTAVVALLDAASAQPDVRKAKRDAALVRLLHDVALRRGEVCKLDMVDVDLAAGQIMVVGKGRRERMSITLPEPTRAALAAWIEVRGREQGPMFFSLDPSGSMRLAARLSGPGLWHIIKTLGMTIGIVTRPHALRHSAITAALDATRGDVRAVQRFSRHRDIRTLQVYDDNREDLAGRCANLIAV
jgi:integrase/recombinase XerC